MGERREECRWMRRGVCVMVESVDFVWLCAVWLRARGSALGNRGLGMGCSGHHPGRFGGRRSD